MYMQAYSPLAKGRQMGDPTLQAVAQRLGATPAQVLIRWVRRGHEGMGGAGMRVRLRSEGGL